LGGSIDKERFDAVLFDLDGVLTATSRIHAACWKEMFDDFLKRRADESGETFSPFDIRHDYLRYVDGKLRYDGVRSFLDSRGIALPLGDPDGPPGYDTICGLGNRKDEMVKRAIVTSGVDVYDGSIELVRRLRMEGLKTAVVSSSNNCRLVLDSVGISDLFEVKVDGHVAVRLNLPGKPAADTYLKAAEELGVLPARAVVIEDAVSGVQAGRNGNFGLVIGVDREGHPEALKAGGADMVVSDLAELLE
jgi:beta-phosphoglucomutase family hydrolase